MIWIPFQILIEHIFPEFKRTDVERRHGKINRLLFIIQTQWINTTVVMTEFKRSSCEEVKHISSKASLSEQREEFRKGITEIYGSAKEYARFLRKPRKTKGDGIRKLKYFDLHYLIVADKQV